MNKYLNITNWSEFFDNLFPISLSFHDDKYGNCEFPNITLDTVDMIDKNENTGVTIIDINLNKWLSIEKLQDADNENKIVEWDNLDYMIDFLQDCKNRRDNK